MHSAKKWLVHLISTKSISIIIHMPSSRPMHFIFIWKTKDVQDKVEKQFEVFSINKINKWYKTDKVIDYWKWLG